MNNYYDEDSTLEEGRIALSLLEKHLHDQKDSDNCDASTGSRPHSLNSERRLLDQIPRDARLHYRKGSPLGLTVEELDDRGLLDGGSVPSYYTSLRHRYRKSLELKPRSSRLQERENIPSSKIANSLFHMLRTLAKRGINFEEYCRNCDTTGRGELSRKQMLTLLRGFDLPFSPRDLNAVVIRYASASSPEIIDYDAMVRDADMPAVRAGARAHANDHDESHLNMHTTVLADVKRMLLESISSLAKDLEDVYQLFARWDTEGSGTITATQFLRVLARLHIELVDQDQDLLVELLDTNAMGRVDFESLLSYCFADVFPELWQANGISLRSLCVAAEDSSNSGAGRAAGVLRGGHDPLQEGRNVRAQAQDSMQAHTNLSASNRRPHTATASRPASELPPLSPRGKVASRAGQDSGSGSRRVEGYDPDNAVMDHRYRQEDDGRGRGSGADGVVKSTGNVSARGDGGGHFRSVKQLTTTHQRPLTASGRVPSHSHSGSGGDGRDRRQTQAQDVTDGVVEDDDNEGEEEDDYLHFSGQQQAHKQELFSKRSSTSPTAAQAQRPKNINSSRNSNHQGFVKHQMVPESSSLEYSRSRGNTHQVEYEQFGLNETQEDGASFNDNTLVTTDQDEYNFTSPHSAIENLPALDPDLSQYHPDTWNNTSLTPASNYNFNNQFANNNNSLDGLTASASSHTSRDRDRDGEGRAPHQADHRNKPVSSSTFIERHDISDRSRKNYKIDANSESNRDGARRGGDGRGGGGGARGARAATADGEQLAEPSDHLLLLAKQILTTLRDMILHRHRSGKPLHEIYQHFDRTSKGSFDRKDFIRAAADLRIEISDKVADLAMKQLVLDDSESSVTYGEFRVFVLDTEYKTLENIVQLQISQLLEQKGRGFERVIVDSFWEEEAAKRGPAAKQAAMSSGLVSTAAFVSSIDKLSLKLPNNPGDMDRIVARFDINGMDSCSVRCFMLMLQHSSPWRQAMTVLTLQDEAVQEAKLARAVMSTGHCGAATDNVRAALDKSAAAGIKITAELLSMAEYLGICVLSEQHMLWIAVDALKAPLPINWTAERDKKGRTFFYNHITNLSRWDHPLDPHFRKLRDQYRRSDQAGDDAEVVGAVPGTIRTAVEDPMTRHRPQLQEYSPALPAALGQARKQTVPTSATLAPPVRSSPMTLVHDNVHVHAQQQQQHLHQYQQQHVQQQPFQQQLQQQQHQQYQHHQQQQLYQQQQQQYQPHNQELQAHSQARSLSVSRSASGGSEDNNVDEEDDNAEQQQHWHTKTPSNPPINHRQHQIMPSHNHHTPLTSTTFINDTIARNAQTANALMNDYNNSLAAAAKASQHQSKNELLESVYAPKQPHQQRQTSRDEDEYVDITSNSYLRKKYSVPANVTSSPAARPTSSRSGGPSSSANTSTSNKTTPKRPVSAVDRVLSVGKESPMHNLSRSASNHESSTSAGAVASSLPRNASERGEQQRNAQLSGMYADDVLGRLDSIIVPKQEAKPKQAHKEGKGPKGGIVLL